MPNDIRLVYIGSAHKAVHYARGHVVPEPRPDQIIAVHEHEQLAGLTLPHWCHIGIELHVVGQETRPALSDANALFSAAVVRRSPPPRKVDA